MRTYLNRICFSLSAADVFCIATTSDGVAGPYTNSVVPAGRAPAALYGPRYPMRLVAPATRVVVLYKAVPVMRQGGGATSVSGAGGGNSGGNSGGSGGDIGDIFKQALGDFAKSAIDGLLKSK
jgi:hypothetical protein